jgi:hypothetical protein
MKSDKARGISLLTADMLKNLPSDALDFVVEAVQGFLRTRNRFHNVAHN